MYPVRPLIPLLILLAPFLKAQDLDMHISTDFQAITVEDGLSQNSVNCILKDHQGFMWFGTRSGLNRYDSYEVRHITSNMEGAEDFSNVDVADLYEDKHGTIWIATISGLFCYDPGLESVAPCKSFPASMAVHCIEAENDSMVWFGTSEGLFLFQIGKGVIEEYTHKPYQNNSLTNSIVLELENDGDLLWIGTEEGLNSFHKPSGSFNQFLHSEKTGSLAGNGIRSLLRSQDGRLWIGTENDGISILEPGGTVFKNLSSSNSDLPHNAIWDIQEGRDSKLWIATNGSGLCKLDPESHEITRYVHNPANPKSLSNNSTYSILEDREGILWVGTFAYGVNFAMAKPGVFKYIYHQPGNPNSLIESKIRSVYMDSRKRLWMGTWGGLSMLDPETGGFVNHSSSEQNPRSLSFNTVTSVIEDSRGRNWVGTYSGGLNLFHERRGVFSHFRHIENDPSSISSDQVYCLTEDMEGQIWIGTNAGLNRYVEESGDFESFNDYDIRDIRVDPQGNLILGIVGGVALFNVENNSIKFFESERLSGYQLNFVSKVHRGRVLFGTQGGGMGLLALDGSGLIMYTDKDGLPSNHVSSCVQVNDSIFWISTYKGLSRFNINAESFRNFGLAEGLPGYEYFPRSGLQLANGDLAFGSSKGLVFFNPDEVDSLGYDSHVLLSQLRIDNNPVPIGIKDSPLKQSLSYTGHIDLSHSEKDFMVEFVALNFRNPGKNNYAYTLENYLDGWRQIGETRNVGFTNLDPGEYVFRVRACNENANQTGLPECTLGITIHPPIWGTWWFRITIFLLVAFLIYVYNRMLLVSRDRKRMLALQKMEYEKQEKFVNMKLRFFSNISHEFRTPLTLILDPLHQLLKLEQDVQAKRKLILIEKSTKRLLKLIEQILDFRKVEADALQLQVREIDMSTLFRGIYESFTEMAVNNEVDYQLVMEEGKLLGWLDDDKVEKILYNILSNSFKFTSSGGRITLSVYSDQLDDSFITFSVNDTGSGITKEKLPMIFDRFYSDQKDSKVSRGGAGIGLAMVKKMIDLHRGSVEVESEKGKGTTFTFTLPTASKYYTDAEKIEGTDADMEALVTSPEPMEEAHAEEEEEQFPQVMLVEDDKDIREYLEEILGVHFEVISAGDGVEALELLDQQRPDLILSDTIMPEMDGIELCKAVKSRDDLMMVPFIFLSVWSSDDFKLKGLHTGADDYITKPFNSDVLIAKIHNTIETRRRFLNISNAKIDIAPGEIHLDNMQTIFVRRVQEVLEENIGDPDFNSKRFREKMNMSHSLLYRNLKNLTGLSSNELIRDYRLKRAAQILKMKTGLSISEVGFKVGFVDSKYFSQCFKKKYKLTPSEFLQRETENSEVGDEQNAEQSEQFTT